MKRIIAIAACLSILYAGALWAFAGCEGLITASAGHDHGDHNSESHHGDASVPRHSDPGKIHCPNLFGEFLVGSRISIDPNPRDSVFVGYEFFRCSPLVQELSPSRFNPGPPGPIVSAHISRQVLLSVIRI